MSLALASMLSTCAPMVSPDTMQSIVTIESGGNPYAIGVVGGRLERQPKTLGEALATAAMLEKKGWNYSVGHAQVNKKNFSKFGVSLPQIFEPCTNLYVGGAILQGCYLQSLSDAHAANNEQFHLARAFSCYYSGRLDSRVGLAYAKKVFSAGGLR